MFRTGIDCSRYSLLALEDGSVFSACSLLDSLLVCSHGWCKLSVLGCVSKQNLRDMRPIVLASPPFPFFFT